jgi:hypothetical protein
MTDTPLTTSELNAAIAELPPELQIRVNVIAEMLRGGGYRVSGFVSADAALQCLRQDTSVAALVTAPVFVRLSDGTNPIATLPVSGTVAATGSAQNNAAALTAITNLITMTGNNQGVILPAGRNVFDQCNVANNTTVNVCVYPPVGGKLNNEATNAPCIMAANTVITFFCIDGTNWLADSI